MAKRKKQAKTTTVTWARVPGARISKSDAELLGAALTAFYQQHRRGMKASELLERAMPAESELHHLFEWDDSRAANAHRLTQAGKLLGSILVEWEDTPGVKISSKGAFGKGDGSGYMPARVVFHSVDLTRELLEQAKKELSSWHARFNNIRAAAELAGVFAAIEAALPEAKERSKAA